jgi:hypothetical protein
MLKREYSYRLLPFWYFTACCGVNFNFTALKTLCRQQQLLKGNMVIVIKWQQYVQGVCVFELSAVGRL